MFSSSRWLLVGLLSGGCSLLFPLLAPSRCEGAGPIDCLDETTQLICQDGFTAAVSCEGGQTCTDGACQESAGCGDGTIDALEQCDDANTQNDDGCSAECLAEPGFLCVGQPSTCDPVCGDGLIAGDEECDDDNTKAGDGCSDLCQLEIPPGCGDLEVTPPEECDDGNLINGDSCDNNCTSPRCGNLIVAGGEECDDGNTTSGDGCDSVCIQEVCGDGLTNNTNEECDEGQANSDTAPDACRTDCTLAGCGDSVVDTNETCDDGNLTDGDGCTALCLLEVCGDGIISTGEECDDNNTTNNDGCSSTCALETIELISNGNFSSAFTGWTLANNPDPTNCQGCDNTITFSNNGGVVNNGGSSGPSARVLIQTITIPALVESAAFTLDFFQENSSPLDPENVTTIEKDPFDQSGDGIEQNAFRIDLISAAGDQFTSPILFELFAPVNAIGAQNNLSPIAVSSAALSAFLQAHEGEQLRLRIGQVESTFPWQLRVDNVSLLIN